MALTVKEAQSFRVARGFGSSSHASLTFREAATQTFKKGAPIVQSGAPNTGGNTVAEGGTDPTHILGIADEAGENNAVAGAKNVRVIPLCGDYMFEGVLGNGDLTDYTLAVTDILDCFGVTKAADGGWFVDKQKAAIFGAGGVRVRVVALKDAAGTVNGKVFFNFLDFVFDSDAAVASQITVVNGLRCLAATAIA
jgi:hypothetical protein